MKRLALVQAIGLVLAMTIGAKPALAQSTEPVTRPVEITPFVSIGSVLSSRVGAAIAFALTPKLSLETEIGYRRGEIGALSSNVSLLYNLPQLGRVTPYLAGGVGLEQYGAPVGQPGVGLVAQSKMAFAVNAGGGLKVPIDNTWGFRTDARWFNGFGRDAGEHWRLYNGVTFGTGALRPGVNAMR